MICRIKQKRFQFIFEKLGVRDQSIISVISSYLLGGFPPESQIPPQKNTQNTKTLKNASNLPPRYVFPPRTWSLALTLVYNVNRQAVPRSWCSDGERPLW